MGVVKPLGQRVIGVPGAPSWSLLEQGTREMCIRVVDNRTTGEP